MISTRKQLSDKYLKSGMSGLEIAPLYNPWPVPKDTQVLYIDRYTTEELNGQYNKDGKKNITPVDLVCDAQELIDIGTGSMDFVLSSHVLEHVPGFIEAFDNMLRVLKPGGFALVAIPDMAKTFDCERLLTPWEHHVSEYGIPNNKYNLALHYYEWICVVDKKLPSQELIKHMCSKESHIHFHTWTDTELRKQIDTMIDLLGTFTLEEYVPLGCENLFVLKRL